MHKNCSIKARCKFGNKAYSPRKSKLRRVTSVHKADADQFAAEAKSIQRELRAMQEALQELVEALIPEEKINPKGMAKLRLNVSDERRFGSGKTNREGKKSMKIRQAVSP